MLVIAGLGNPGSKYAGNRHNIGFMAADEIVRRHGFGPWKTRFSAQVSQGELDGQKAFVLKPQTFMNESGRSVSELIRFYKLDLADLVVIYDELDLPPGKLRVKTGGGAGGHNGIRSIDAHCGKDYRRMRLGIGHPGRKELVTRHVLGDFAKADREWLDPLLDAVAEHAHLLANGQDAGFMNKVALATGQNANGQNAKDQKPTGQKPKDQKPKGQKPKGQSHIRQARPKPAPANMPKTGPMAEMLKKLFGDKE